MLSATPYALIFRLFELGTNVCASLVSAVQCVQTELMLRLQASRLKAPLKEGCLSSGERPNPANLFSRSRLPHADINKQCKRRYCPAAKC